jgi:hypothetical protein
MENEGSGLEIKNTRLLGKYKNILLVCIFLLIFKMLDLAIGETLNYYKYFSTPDMHSLTWNDFYSHKDKSIDVLFIGSSHARFAFDTRTFNKELGVSTFNLSSSGQTPVVGYYALKEALRYQKPKLVVYETYWRIMGTDDNITPAYFVYDYIKGYDNKLGILTSVCGEKNFSTFMLQALCKTYKNREAFVQTVKSILKGHIIKSPRNSDAGVKYADFTYYSDGFFGSDKVASNEKMYKTNPFSKAGPGFELDREQIEYLKKAIELCNDKGIKVLMVTAPLPVPSMSYIKDYGTYHNSLMDIAQNYGIQYLDYNQDNIKNHMFKNEYFYDSNHLNMRGTQMLDELLIPVIGDYLK